MTRKKVERLPREYLRKNMGNMVGPCVRGYDRATKTWRVDIVYGDEFSQHIIGELKVDSETESITAPAREDLEVSLLRQQQKTKFIAVQIDPVTEEALQRIHQMKEVRRVSVI